VCFVHIYDSYIESYRKCWSYDRCVLNLPCVCRVCAVRFFRNRIASLFHRKRNTRKSRVSVSFRVCAVHSVHFAPPLTFHPSHCVSHAHTWHWRSAGHSVSHYTTIRCNTLQHAATRCWFEVPLWGDGDACSCCNILQHTATLLRTHCRFEVPLGGDGDDGESCLDVFFGYVRRGIANEVLRAVRRCALDGIVCVCVYIYIYMYIYLYISTQRNPFVMSPSYRVAKTHRIP